MTTNEQTGGMSPTSGATSHGGPAAGEGTGEVHWSIRVPAAELARFAPLGALCDDDERKPFGGIVLECDGAQRWWSAGDADLAVRCEGGPTATVGRVVLPRRVLPVGPVLAGPDGSVELVIEECDGVPSRVTIQGPGGRVSVPLPEQRSLVHARFVQHDAEARPEAGFAEVTVPAGALQRLVHMARIAPVGPPPGKGVEAISGPMPWLVLDEGEVRIEVDWDGIGEFEYALVGDGIGTARCIVAPGALDHALAAMDGDVVLRVPTGPGAFVSVTEPGASVALLTRVPEPATILVDRLVECLRAAFPDDFEEMVHGDGGRSLAVSVDGIRVDLQVQESDLLLLRLRAVALDGVRGTFGLLREINDLNLGLDLVRVAWADRRIEVVADVALEACDAEVVVGALFRVVSVVRDLAPILRLVHGGTAPEPSTVVGD